MKPFPFQFVHSIAVFFHKWTVLDAETNDLAILVINNSIMWPTLSTIQNYLNFLQTSILETFLKFANVLTNFGEEKN